MSVQGIDNCRRALCTRRVIWLHRQTEAAIQTRLEFFLFWFYPTPSLHFVLVYKISESCANKPQRRLHLIYLQQNVQKLKLLRKCNFALRVFHIRIRIPIRIHVHLACFQHVRICGGSAGVGEDMQLAFWRPQTRRRRQEVDSIGKDVARNTRREESRQVTQEKEEARGKEGCKWRRNRCVCANEWFTYPARHVGASKGVYWSQGR